jgi:DNA-binding NtrC family response regulator
VTSTGTAEGRATDILVVSNMQGDLQRIQAWVGEQSPLQLRWVRNGYEMLDAIRRERVPVVVCRTDLPDTTWKHVLITLQEFHLPPTVIVLSDREDIDLWTEVLNQGGFDTVHRGTTPDTARQMLRQAHRRWMRREEILTARKMNPRSEDPVEERIAG